MYEDMLADELTRVPDDVAAALIHRADQVIKAKRERRRGPTGTHAKQRQVGMRNLAAVNARRKAERAANPKPPPAPRAPRERTRPTVTRPKTLTRKNEGYVMLPSSLRFRQMIQALYEDETFRRETHGLDNLKSLTMQYTERQPDGTKETGQRIVYASVIAVALERWVEQVERGKAHLTKDALRCLYHEYVDVSSYDRDTYHQVKISKEMRASMQKLVELPKAEFALLPRGDTTRKKKPVAGVEEPLPTNDTMILILAVAFAARALPRFPKLGC